MQKEKPSKPTGRPNIGVNVTSHYIHQDEIDRIKKLDLPYEELLKEVDNSYRNGKIYAIEADVILSESQSKKQSEKKSDDAELSSGRKKRKKKSRKTSAVEVSGKT